MTGFVIYTNEKKDNYNSILVIVDWQIKMVYYKVIKITINAPSLTKVIINIVVYYYGFLKSIVTNSSSLFISKFK